jgi:hypothetical protein
MSAQANQSSNYRSRLAQLRSRRLAAGTSKLEAGMFTPTRGGYDRQMSIQPIIYGEELALVKDASSLCLGRIGFGGNVCLKRSSSCDTESHAKKKGSLPDGTSLILIKGDEKGYEDIVLDANDLDKGLIDELLQRKNVSWPSEFAKIKSNDTKTVVDMEFVEGVLNTARKHRSFNSPAKKQVTEDVFDTIALLDTSQRLLLDILELDIDADSGEVTGKDFTFDEESYVKVCTDVYDRLEVLAENSKCLNDVVMNLQPFMESQTKPLEEIVSGLRFEMASLEGQLGNKDLLRKDVPPCLWSAVETGFDSLLEIKEKMNTIHELAAEAHEVAGCLLAAEEEKLIPSTSTESDSKISSGNFFDNLTKTTLVDGKIHRPPTGSTVNQPFSNHSDSNPNRNSNGGNGNGNSGSSGGGDDNPMKTNCDNNDLLCGRCMVKFNDLEAQLIDTNVRVGNLEDAKSGNVESAILIKNKVYRGRADIAAELAGWFPEASGKKVDAGLFPTPHLLLNLIHADICSKKAPKAPMEQRDLLRSGIRRSDADAFYALQSPKPEFMISSEVCPNFNYKTSEAQRKKATIKFLPSHEDFGNGIDGESLHSKFKESLEHIKGERERYIESKLSDHPDPRVLSISKQLLNDSCKFITQMLGFMDETYAACYESFGATTEAWELVSHCIEEIFTKELKPCLQFSVAQDLFDLEDALVGVIHAAFSLNCKVREITSVSLKNHHSTTTSHVRFVMKMAKTSRKLESKPKEVSDKPSAIESKMKATIANLEKENSDLKTHVKRVESRLDSFKGQIKKFLGVTEDELNRPAPRRFQAGAKKENADKKE